MSNDKELRQCPFCKGNLSITYKSSDNRPCSYWLTMRAFMSCDGCEFKFTVKVGWEQIQKFLTKKRIKDAFETENTYISDAAKECVNGKLYELLLGKTSLNDRVMSDSLTKAKEALEKIADYVDGTCFEGFVKPIITEALKESE